MFLKELSFNDIFYGLPYSLLVSHIFTLVFYYQLLLIIWLLFLFNQYCKLHSTSNIFLVIVKLFLLVFPIRALSFSYTCFQNQSGVVLSQESLSYLFMLKQTKNTKEKTNFHLFVLKSSMTINKQIITEKKSANFSQTAQSTTIFLLNLGIVLLYLQYRYQCDDIFMKTGPYTEFIFNEKLYIPYCKQFPYKSTIRKVEKYAIIYNQ